MGIGVTLRKSTCRAKCASLQHAATPCLKHTATEDLPAAPPLSWQECVSLQYTATRCNTLQHTATRCNTLQQNVYLQRRRSRGRSVSHCNTLPRMHGRAEGYGIHMPPTRPRKTCLISKRWPPFFIRIITRPKMLHFIYQHCVFSANTSF